MYQLILLIHVFIAVFMIAVILVQQGKGATMGAAFGSGASQTVFGSRGSGSFLFRVTISLGILFFITSLTLNYMATSAYKQQKVINFTPPPTQPASTQPTNDQSVYIPKSSGTTTTTTITPEKSIPVRK